jgi:hypothetical protein
VLWVWSRLWSFQVQPLSASSVLLTRTLPYSGCSAFPRA